MKFPPLSTPVRRCQIPGRATFPAGARNRLVRLLIEKSINKVQKKQQRHPAAMLAAGVV
jgi:hypothetical protein